MKGVPGGLADFVKLRREVEGVVQHVGLGTWDLVMVDVTGLWVRYEFPTKEAALHACERLGVRAHEGWDEQRLVRRMRGRDQWATPDGQRRAR